MVGDEQTATPDPAPADGPTLEQAREVIRVGRRVEYGLVQKIERLEAELARVRPVVDAAREVERLIPRLWRASSPEGAALDALGSAIETAEILADPDTMAAIREGEAAAAAGDVVSLDEMRDVVAGLGGDAAATPPPAAAPETSPAADAGVERLREKEEAALLALSHAADTVARLEKQARDLESDQAQAAMRGDDLADAARNVRRMGVDNLEAFERLFRAEQAWRAAAPVAGDPDADERASELHDVDRCDGVSTNLETAERAARSWVDGGEPPGHPPTVVGYLLDGLDEARAALAAAATSAVAGDPAAARAGAFTEWGAKWSDGGCCPSTPPRSEDFARQHARNFGTRPIRRGVGPWVYDDTGEPAFDEPASPSTDITPSPEG